MLPYFTVIVTTIENFSSKQNPKFLKSQRIKPFQTLQAFMFKFIHQRSFQLKSQSTAPLQIIFRNCNKIFSHKMKNIKYEMKQNVLENFVKITGKHMCQSLRLATLLKNKFRRRCVVVNFAKFLRAAILKSTFSGCFFTSLVFGI